VQDALTEAVRRWPVDGVPSNPGGWLHATARRKAIDRLRRRSSAARRLRAAADELVRDDEPIIPDNAMIDDEQPFEVGDEHLRLVLLCCHPALDREAQVALTLRLVGGLTTAEIASAFLVPEATLAQRIVRAKRKIRDAAIPLALPTDLSSRLGVVLTVLYLVFNEGHLSHQEGADVRIDLVDEAIRLTRVLAALVPDDGETDGLLALELFHRARAATRVDGAGELVLLEHQDRSRWDLATVREGNAVLARAMRRMAPGPFQVQAVIAAHHANAPTAADTDWPAIVTAYEQLARMAPSPVVELNRAVAVAMADGPRAGLALVDRIDGLDDYHLFHAARGELLARDGRPAEAAEALQRARALAARPVERRHLDRRLAQLT
jgi:RNA polymerase sigma-70 factor, ECF subfamily